jgi:hypothetical protein
VTGTQAAYYIVDPSPKEAGDHWHTVTLPETGHSVISVQSACLGSFNALKTRTPGFATLIERPGDAGYALNIDSFSGSPLVRGSAAALRIQNLGKVHDLCSTPNCYRFNDIYAATDHGIAYFSSQALAADPVILLEHVSFRQVAVSEVANTNIEKNTNVYARLSLLAVSEANELYFAQGIRDNLGNVTFNCSGIAIRTGYGGSQRNSIMATSALKSFTFRRRRMSSDTSSVMHRHRRGVRVPFS